MGRLAESLQRYFDTTPKEQLDKDWEEIKPLNDMSPIIIIDYDNMFKYGKNEQNIINNIEFGDKIKKYFSLYSQHPKNI